MTGINSEFIDVTVCSLPEYMSVILSMNPEKSDSNLFPHTFCYRGLADSTWDLEPSIGREPNQSWLPGSRLVFERIIIETAVSRYPDIFGKYDCPLQLLAKLQHYGIPTRLLDVTTNALVGLYFACNKLNEENKENPNNFKDGEVIVFSGIYNTRYNSFVSLIADTYDLVGNGAVDIETYITRFRTKSYSARLLYDNGTTLSTEQLEYNLSVPLFAEPGFVSQRQINQAGKFIIFPNRIRENNVTTNLVKLNKSNPPVIGRIKIKKEFKKKILFDLERFGITSDFLFPDNIDSNCAQIIKSIDDRFVDYHKVESDNRQSNKK